jgi:hypothetical protein
MSSERVPSPAGGARGLLADLRALAAEQRLAGIAAGVLLLTMFLPWYTKDTTAAVNGQPVTVSENRMAVTVFSFVEAAIFLVAVGVGVLLLARARGKAFHLPGGDGLVVTAAGAWATFLVFFRFVDKPQGQTGRGVLTDYGLSWGIFFGLLAALFLAYTGVRLRQARVAEPALPGSDPDPALERPAAAVGDPSSAAERAAARRARRAAAQAGGSVAVREDPIGPPPAWDDAGVPLEPPIPGPAPRHADPRRRPAGDAAPTIVDRRGTPDPADAPREPGAPPRDGAPRGDDPPGRT